MNLHEQVEQRRLEAARLEAELEEEKRRLTSCFKRLFNSDDGRQVLKHLDSRFRRGPIAVPGDEVSTHMRVGERNVVEYIITTIEREGSDVQVEDGVQSTGG